MSHSRHTPGPWEIQNPHRADHIETNPFCCDIGANQEVGFASVQSHSFPYGVRHEEAEANARLIAAAPELLHALEMVRDADDDCKMDGENRLPIPDVARDCIDRAIAKAKGGQS